MTPCQALTPPFFVLPCDQLKQVLVDEESGLPTNLEGRARGSIVEVTLDHEEGSLSFRLNGGPEGYKISGFPVGDTGGMLLRPVIGFRAGAMQTSEDDQVTLRGPERLRQGWPQIDDALRERDLRGVIAARCLGRALDSSHASNRMRLASFRLMHSPR